MKKLLFTLVLLVGLSFFACNRGDDDDSTGGGVSFFLVKELGTSLGVPDSANESLVPIVFDSLWQGNTVSSKDLYINLEVKETEYVSMVRTPSDWGTAAYAEVEEERLKYDLTSISISSNESLQTSGQEFIAGDELSQLFLFGYDWDWENLGFKAEQAVSLGDIVSERRRLTMKLDAELVKPLDQTITITLNFEDGSQLSTTTGRVLAK